MMDQYTPQAREALSLAVSVAESLNHGYVGTEHLLIGLLQEGNGVAAKVLEENGVEESRVIDLVSQLIAPNPTLQTADKNAYTPRARRVIENSYREAVRFKAHQIGTEHILISILRESDCVASRLLNTIGVNVQKLYIDLLSAMGEDAPAYREELQSGRAGKRGNATPTLDEYSRNLTQMAKEGKLDPVIGREAEIQRLVQILSRRTKNNPCLIGEPGVGKTAVVEGLAQMIVLGDVPETILDKRVMTLDLSGMVAGSKYRGEFEERIKKVISEVIESGDVLLFIDEIHTIIGAGGAEGALDASNILKPSLARGELQLIGATTVEEYRKYIEKDAALERRFQPVMVSEPSVEDTIAILRGLKERYEVHHGVRITDAAIVAAATLSDRYISDRFLPDKAVDLVDEAAARLKIELDSMPTEIDQIEREAMQLEMERQALAKEEDADSKARLEKITKDLADLKEKSGSMIAKWKSEKEVLDAVRREQEKIEALKLESERAKRMGDLTRASEITYGELPEAQRALTEGKEKLSKMQKEDGGLLKEEVTEGDIAKVVATWTGIPAARLQEGERAKLVHMEERLGARVIGQKQAVKAVSDAVRRARAGLQDENRPIGSFLFLGPTGVGKTELSKALAEFLFDSENAIVRIDMSEYMEKHSVARLIGAPPGYVGYEEGGQLSEAVRRRPYCVVLFDEIEKAHPDVFNVLLQVLDDGRITDGQGRTVDFRNTVIIMTSNIGSQYILNEANAEQREAKALEALRGHFRPEFLNRIDEIIIFDRLTAQELKGIVDIQLQRVRRRLEAKGLFLRMTPEATALVADHGFDPVYGARPLKRAIQHDLLDPLSLKLLEGDFPEGTEIVVREKDGKLDFTKEKR